MNGRMKALSAVLAIVAIVGLVASGMTVNDVLGAKSYWEQKSIESDENLAKLEDGLNQLQDNEQAYLDGRKELADGKAEYAEGQKTLADGYAEYAQGQQDYKDGKKEYADGKALLESKTAAFEEGKVQKLEAKKVFDVVNMMIGGVNNMEAFGIISNLTGNDFNLVKAGYEQGDDATVAANRASLTAAKFAYDQYHLFTDVAMLNSDAYNTAASVAANIGVSVTAAKIEELHQGINTLMANPGTPEAAADILIGQGKIKDTVRDDVISLYSLVQCLYNGNPAPVMEVSNGGVISAGTINAIVNAVADAESNGDPDPCQTIGSDINFGSLGKETVTNICTLYNHLMSSCKGNLGASKDTLLTSLESQAAYAGMEAIMASSGSLSNSVAVVAASNTSFSEDLITLVYTMIGGYTNTLPETTAKALLANMMAAMGSTSTVDDALAAGSPQGQAEKKALIDSAENAYKTVEAMKAAAGQPNAALATMAAMAGKDLPTIQYAYQMGSPNGQAAIQAKLDEYTNGQAKLRAAKVELDAAPGKLADAEKQLAEGEAKLADAAKQIAEGEEKLAEFEDGAAEAKDGIQQVVDTEPDGWLASIASRLPEDFGYEKENGDLEIAKGFEAIAAARDYKKDSGAAIETELYGRIYGIVAVAIASILALIAAILGFTKKYKGAIPCAAIAAIAAAVAAFLTTKAGTVFSVIAGSTLGSFALVAGIALAVVAVVHAVASGSAAKAV